MKKIIRYCVCALGATLMTSCSNKLNDKQKAAITSISVADHEVIKGAKKPVNGSKAPGVANTLPIVTGGGVLPALLGQAIDAGVVTVQKNNFKKQYGSKLEELNAIAYPKLAEAIEARGISVLKKDSFFGPKWTDKAGAHYFDGEITTYGLERRNRASDETYLEAMVGINVWLISDGKKLFTTPIIMRSQNAYTVASYVEKPSRLKQVFGEAIDDFETQFQALLDTKLGR